jgi:DNA polymerase sigma
MPPLRALVLVLKALLKQSGLNEVHQGGLSSYSVTLMVISHLQRSGFQLVRDAGVPPHRQLATGGNAPHDLGELLLGFLKFFTEDFNYARQAVSVERVRETSVHCGGASLGSAFHFVLLPYLTLMIVAVFEFEHRKKPK